jgi:dihydroorotase-like cyclic amidohydrolase
MKNKMELLTKECFNPIRLRRNPKPCRRAANLQKFISTRIHRENYIPTVSTAKSVQLIKEAKAKGLNISCVAVHHLVMTDENWKALIPDLKYHSTKNRSGPKALLNAVDNTIDMITSDHNPVDIEHKKMELYGQRWNYRS